MIVITCLDQKNGMMFNHRSRAKTAFSESMLLSWLPISLSG